MPTKKLFKSQQLQDEIVYLNLSDLDQEEFVDSFNVKYPYKKGELTTNYPAFVFFEDGKVRGILQEKNSLEPIIPTPQPTLQMEKEIIELAEKQKYEKAAILRDKKIAIERIEKCNGVLKEDCVQKIFTYDLSSIVDRYEELIRIFAERKFDELLIRFAPEYLKGLFEKNLINLLCY